MRFVGDLMRQLRYASALPMTRRVAIVAVLACSLAPGRPSATHSRLMTGSPQPAAERVGPALAAPQASAFRLGTAGGPFAAATAIADLDGNGTVDFAIADRVGHRPGGYTYAIEVWLAGKLSDVVRFNAAHQAMALVLHDIDHDRDVDIVLTQPLRGDIVAVWLNDGTGRFERSDRQGLLPRPHVVDSMRRAASAPSALAPARTGDLTLAVRHGLSPPVTRWRVASPPVCILSSAVRSSHALRGPPSPSRRSA